jgi:ribosomal protein S18 acetylase RimI-like enzyme
MSIRDLDFVLSQTVREGWSSCRDDFEELIKHDSTGSFVGEINGEPIGMVCSVNYGEIGFIGNLIVENKFRGHNYGRLLMEYAMKYLLNKGTMSIFLDAVPKAITLYEQLGFRKIAKSLRLESSFIGESPQNTRPMSDEDLKKVVSLDSLHFGDKRENFLQMRYSKHPELSFVLDDDDELLGYIMGSYSGQTLRVGPWVMHNHSPNSNNLLLALAEASSTNLMKIGVLETNKDTLAILKKYGFKEMSFSWRMLYGKDTDATQSNHLYAIGGPDRG